VRVFPQGYAAVAPFKTNLRGVSVVADIGNGTMNTMFMENSSIVKDKMFTDKKGTYQCTLKIREEFSRQTHREMPNLYIDDVLKSGYADVAPNDLLIMRSAAGEYVKDIFKDLREHGYDPQSMTLHVSGGGACLIKNFAPDSAGRIKYIDDICANAKGYEYPAELMLRSGK